MANKKHGGNKASCEKYKKTGQRELNKELKKERHLKVHPKDVNNKGPFKYARKK